MPTLKLPSIVVEEAEVDPWELRTKLAGKVTIIFPSAGVAFKLVKLTVALPVTPATTLTGETLAVVIVLGITVKLFVEILEIVCGPPALIGVNTPSIFTLLVSPGLGTAGTTQEYVPSFASELEIVI